MSNRQDQADGRMVRRRKERGGLERQTGEGGEREERHGSQSSTHSYAGRSVLCPQRDVHTVIIYLERGDV